MSVEISADDFTTDEPTLPLTAETPASEPSHDAAAADTPPVETPEPEPEPPPSDDVPPAAASGERNADGTFKKVDKKKKPQERIDHVTWEREQARREAATERERREALERELHALRSSRSEPAPAPRPAPQVAIDPNDPEPKEADFEEYGKFVKALSRWEARQEYREQDAQRQAHASQQTRETFHVQRATQFQSRIGTTPEDIAAATADVHPAILQLPLSSSLQPGQRALGMHALGDALSESENPRALMRYWTEHFDDFRRLLPLHPIQVIREVGRLEARLDPAPAGSGSQPPPVSQAKPPIRPVGSAPASSDESPGDDTSFDDHIRYHNAKEKVPPPRRRR